MGVEVRYRCPRCDAIVSLEREASLADRSVTPYPLEGWDYADPAGDVEAADGVRFVCGEAPGAEADGCGEAFYLSYVRYHRGEPVEAAPPSEFVELAVGTRPRRPRRPPG